MPAVQRARGGKRPGLAHHAGGEGRRQVGDDGPEDLDLVRPAGPVRHPHRPHRPRRCQAAGHLVLRMSDGPPGHHHPPDRRDDRRRHAFNEVFLDEVRIPADNLVGGRSTRAGNWPRSPWATSGCRCPRAGPSGAGVRRPGTCSTWSGQGVARPIPSCASGCRAAHRGGDPSAHPPPDGDGPASGASPGPEASIRKVIADEHGQQVIGLAKDLDGRRRDAGRPRAAGASPDPWAYGFLFAPALTVGGGTGEVQRNILGERVLGLPARPRAGRPLTSGCRASGGRGGLPEEGPGGSPGWWGDDWQVLGCRLGRRQGPELPPRELRPSPGAAGDGHRTVRAGGRASPHDRRGRRRQGHAGSRRERRRRWERRERLAAGAAGSRGHDLDATGPAGLGSGRAAGATGARPCLPVRRPPPATTGGMPAAARAGSASGRATAIWVSERTCRPRRGRPAA